MRKETKIGIIIGIIIVAGVAVYFANKDKNASPAIPDTLTQDETTTNQPETKDSNLTTTSSNNSLSSDSGSLSAETPEVDVLENEIEDTAAVDSMADEVEDKTETAESDNRDQIVTSLLTEQTNPEPKVTKAVKDDPLLNLPESYPDQITETKYHTIQKGDNLYSISTEYFGTGKYWKEIYDTNRNIIKNESSLTIGWKIRIPTPDEIE